MMVEGTGGIIVIDDQIAREIGVNVDGDELDALYDTYDTRAREIGTPFRCLFLFIEVWAD